jgi:hypothetical protein
MQATSYCNSLGFGGAPINSVYSHTFYKPSKFQEASEKVAVVNYVPPTAEKVEELGAARAKSGPKKTPKEANFNQATLDLLAKALATVAGSRRQRKRRAASPLPPPGAGQTAERLAFGPQLAGASVKPKQKLGATDGRKQSKFAAPKGHKAPSAIQPPSDKRQKKRLPQLLY